MRGKVIFAAFVLVLCSNAASGQTVSDVEKKYGKPVNAYSVSEHIWMTPAYASDGQICRATLYHKRISSEQNYVGTTYMPMWELLGVFNELAPLNTRGAKKRYFGDTQHSASMAWTTFEYEKVRFSIWVGFKFGSLADMEEKGVSLRGAPVITNQPDDEFMAKNSVYPEMAYVTWNDRKCVGR